MKCFRGFFIVVCFLIISTGYSFAGDKLISYGFEDWTGDASTTPGYVFSTDDSGRWLDHTNGTEIVTSCGGKGPHSGTYFYHMNWYTGEVDSCLGTSPTTTNARNNTGLNSYFPSDPKNNVDFDTAVVSNVGVARFYFRTTGNWKTQINTNGGNMGYLKFFRWYGGAAGGDAASALVHLLARDSNDTRYKIYDPSNATWESFYSGIDLYDGNWHVCAVRVVRNNDTGATGNITISVWWDDYEMQGDPNGGRTITAPSFADHFNYLALFNNWSATYPTSSIGIDMDDLEVWDGMPDSSSTVDNHPSITIAPPSTSTNPIIISGTSSDDKGVSSISWSNNRGESGTVSSDLNSWSVTGIILVEGDTEFTFTARDTVGQELSASVTVSYAIGEEPDAPTDFQAVNN